MALLVVSSPAKWVWDIFNGRGDIFNGRGSLPGGIFNGRGLGSCKRMRKTFYGWKTKHQVMFYRACHLFLCKCNYIITPAEPEKKIRLTQEGFV